MWPQSLFGRLIGATVIGVLLAQMASLYLVARNEQRVMTQVTTRIWARRISEIAFTLTLLPPRARAHALRRLQMTGGLRPVGPRFWVRRMLMPMRAPQPMPPPEPPRPSARVGPGRRPRPVHWPWWRRGLHPDLRHGLLIHLPLPSGAQPLLLERLRRELGAGYRVRALARRSAAAIPVAPPPFGPVDQPVRFYDIEVSAPHAATLTFRVPRLSPVVILPPRLLINLMVLMAVLIAALYVAARGITRPLRRLARAAEMMGRGARSSPLPQSGARELREAARAFNSMQERLHRYLDSRTAVLAAMSHDLKTPLTRLRLQVETLIEDLAVRERLGRELDEMEGMVRGALALFRGQDEQEVPEATDIDALIESVRQGFAEMGHDVQVMGHANGSLPARPQALKRCLTNLVSNAVKFGERARIEVRDGAALSIVVSDEGPGIAPAYLERVFEPFFRLETSRNRDTGGTGLGLSIARDVAQAHGGTLQLRNRPQGGLEAELRLPRR
ncbi:MAG: ATP-binding protein [Pseudomonadota bacterium]|nr:ATP-binding protein [Pseudomonadota bacterium]